MPAHGARQHHPLQVAPARHKILNLVAVRYAGHILLDDRAVVQHLGDVVAGGADQLYAARMRCVVGPRSGDMRWWPLDSRSEGAGQVRFIAIGIWPHKSCCSSKWRKRNSALRARANSQLSERVPVSAAVPLVVRICVVCGRVCRILVFLLLVLRRISLAFCFLFSAIRPHNQPANPSTPAHQADRHSRLPALRPPPSRLAAATSPRGFQCPASSVPPPAPAAQPPPSPARTSVSPHPPRPECGAGDRSY